MFTTEIVFFQRHIVFVVFFIYFFLHKINTNVALNETSSMFYTNTVAVICGKILACVFCCCYFFNIRFLQA